MKKFLLECLTVLLLSNIIQGQDLSISESRKQNLKQVLDYRFKGGFYSFESLFNKTVEYPDIALQNCVMGIIITSFEVNCKGEIEKVSLKTLMRYGIDVEISKFFNATKGHWNTCEDEKYTRFDIPIQFRIEGVETNTTDALLVKEGITTGYVCHDDDYFLEKAKKYIEKGKGNKAMPYINILILRNPYDVTYTELRDKAGSLTK